MRGASALPARLRRVLRPMRIPAIVVLTLALVAALLIGIGYIRDAESRAFREKFAQLELGMTRNEVRALLGPPAKVEVQPAYGVIVRVQRLPSVGLQGNLNSWYYGGDPDDPKTNLYVVDFDRNRLFFADHVGRGG